MDKRKSRQNCPTRDLRPVISTSLTESSNELKTALDSVELMKSATNRPFNDTQKAAARKILLETNLCDPEIVRQTVLASSTKSQLLNMTRDQNTQVNIGENIVRMVTNYFSFAQRIDEAIRTAKKQIDLTDLLPAFLMSFREQSGIDKEQMSSLFHSLNSDFGNEVGSIFNLLLNNSVSNYTTDCSLSAVRIMDELRYQLSSELDTTLEVEPFHYTNIPDAEPCKIYNLLMGTINSHFTANRNFPFSRTELALSKICH